ncbi:phosphoribosyltransferase [Amycolatopsis coloradensis]|uniref:Phosphoribosyltransferase n=1 Tax=Amycolatopsis coloradensis TaxID=76021 RepID=A0A1R0L0C1_9PSEU|nr:phosphoribosyltransferase family protein [Amycolatopsis coloradensis]OLZ55174.1 phosphoribosyltransferase [Amycolatopsis coloradensis]
MTTAHRDFDHHRIWRVTPETLHDATTLLTDAILRDHPSVERVIGIANGGVSPAHLIATTAGLNARIVRARHNTSDDTYQQATGNVSLDLTPLTRSLNGQRLKGRVLVVDDICGSGATLRRVRDDLTPLLGPDAQILTAVLCLNTGATTLPDYSIWTVSDWVVFPWEQPSTDQDTTPLPPPKKVFRHA